MAHDGAMRTFVVVPGVTLAFTGLIVRSFQAFGPRSVRFAFVVVWLPMAWLGTLSRFVRPRLPERYHALRDFELDGRMYERLGVRTVKKLLRRRPFAVFNPDLHLPAERTSASLAHLDQRMRDAEASHAILALATLGVVAHATARGWRSAALSTMAFDVVVNGYPVMLQRYNRALLSRVSDTR